MRVIFQYRLLRKRRKEKHLTQEVLAELCGCSSRYLRDLEHGIKRNPSAKLAQLLANALDLTVEDLFDIQEEF